MWRFACVRGLKSCPFVRWFGLRRVHEKRLEKSPSYARFSSRALCGVIDGPALLDGGRDLNEAKYHVMSCDSAK